MKGSPMKRNFGIGETEAPDKASPAKLPILGKILKGGHGAIQAGLDAGAGTSYGKDKEAAAAAEKKRLQSQKDKDAAMNRQKELMDYKSKLSKGKKTVEGDLNGDGVVDEHDKKLQEETTGADAGADAGSDAGADAGTAVEYNKKKRKKTPGKFLGGLIPKPPMPGN